MMFMPRAVGGRMPFSISQNHVLAAFSTRKRSALDMSGNTYELMIHAPEYGLGGGRINPH